MLVLRIGRIIIFYCKQLKILGRRRGKFVYPPVWLRGYRYRYEVCLSEEGDSLNGNGTILRDPG